MDRTWHMDTEVGEFCVKASDRTEARVVLAAYFARAAALSKATKAAGGIERSVGEVIGRDLQVTTPHW